MEQIRVHCKYLDKDGAHNTLESDSCHDAATVADQRSHLLFETAAATRNDREMRPWMRRLRFKVLGKTEVRRREGARGGDAAAGGGTPCTGG